MDEFKYSWTPPILRKGDTDVHFIDHRGNIKIGECLHIETKYGNNGEARHSYNLRADGNQSGIWISENNLIGLH